MKPGEIRQFWAERKSLLNEEARHGIAAFHRSAWGVAPAVSPEAAFEESFAALVGEAELAGSLIDGTGPMLEVGGGVGLLHAFLRMREEDCWSIEPSAAGFVNSFETGRAVLQSLGLPTDRWFPMMATEASQLCQQFVLIFSNNLLEHVADLEATFRSLAAVLAEGGTMVHHTVNYRIPYEPHFGIPLVPLRPRLTKKLWPFLNDQPVWNGLNFVTPGSVTAAATAAGLESRWTPGLLAWTFDRMENDPAFRERHGHFLPVWRKLQQLGMGALLRNWPPRWATPMRVTLQRKR